MTDQYTEPTPFYEKEEKQLAKEDASIERAQAKKENPQYLRAKDARAISSKQTLSFEEIIAEIEMMAKAGNYYYAKRLSGYAVNEGIVHKLETLGYRVRSEISYFEVNWEAPSEPSLVTSDRPKYSGC